MEYFIAFHLADYCAFTSRDARTLRRGKKRRIKIETRDTLRGG